MRAALILVAAYFLGSLPWSLWISNARGIDLRRTGSGNLGATNVYRALGPTWGLTVLALDLGKGAAAVAMARRLGADLPAWLPVAALLTVVLGHVFTVFAQFKGGKGVAAGLGGLLALAPLAGGIAAGVWVLFFALTRTVSVASLAAFLVLPVVTVFAQRARPDYPYLVALTVGLMFLVWFRHRDNLRRLMTGEEHRLEIKK